MVTSNLLCQSARVPTGLVAGRRTERCPWFYSSALATFTGPALCRTCMPAACLPMAHRTLHHAPLATHTALPCLPAALHLPPATRHTRACISAVAVAHAGMPALHCTCCA